MIEIFYILFYCAKYYKSDVYFTLKADLSHFKCSEATCD